MSKIPHTPKKPEPDKSVATLKTDCPLWPYLEHYLYATENQLTALTALNNIKQTDKKVILNGFLKSLSQRIMNTANNVLVAEREILTNTTKPKKNISTSKYFELLRHNKHYLEDILFSYPELDRALKKITDNYASFTIEFIINLNSDRRQLSKISSIQDHESVIECSVSESETHNASRTVVVVTFSSNTKIVYKPRGLLIEASASNILEYLCTKASQPYSDLLIPKYLSRENYGWAQHTGQQDATSESDVSIFYMRVGFLLGFCTSITASDITSDNLIAHGAHPIPIDLETVFYSVITQTEIPKEIRWNASHTSILPNWTWKGADRIGVDLSAIGGLTEQYVSINFYQHIIDEHNDRYGMDGVKILPGANILYFNKKPCSPWLYESQIREGFAHFISVSKQNITYFIAQIKALEGCRARFVPRATATYHYAIQCSLHPTLMASTESRRNFLQKILSSDTPPAKGFLNSEILACMDLDIPYGQIELGKYDFVEPTYGGYGLLDKQQFQDGISHSIEYISSMSEQRKCFELNLISNSLSALKNMYQHQEKLTEHCFRQHDDIRNFTDTDVGSLFRKIREAHAKNVNFITTTLKVELETNGLWLGFHASPGGYMEYSELGDDFYYGISGILYGCILASQYSHIPRSTLVALADLCYVRVRRKLENAGTHLGGFHFGLASAIVPLYLSLVYLEDCRASRLSEHFKHCLHVCLNDDWWPKYL